MYRMSSYRAQAPFRRMPATTRPAPWPRSRSGLPPLSARSISRILGLSYMRKHKTGLAGILLAASLLGLSAGAAMPESINPQDFVQVERGRYLAILGDCTRCHTVEGNGKEFAGGRPLETPFGQMVPPNITPDRETGIGAWTDDEFVNALTKGTGRDGKHIYPVMPYTYFTKMTR